MSDNLFATEFFNCLIASETSNRFSLSEYFTDAYNRNYDFCGKLPYLLSRRDVSVTSPFSYEAANLDAFCLIYTTKGAGKLFCESSSHINAAYDLTKGTLALINCRKNHKLLCQHNIWEYTICFVSPQITDCYFEMLQKLGECVFKLSSLPDVLNIWEQLLKLDNDDEIHGILRSHKLISLFTQLYVSRTLEINGSYHVPSYISDMKKCFDNEYEEAYSLDELAVKYNVNKFRLCREFSKYYKDTPLQYLNHVRLEKAKELLLNSDEKIGVIGQIVGIENTNHFIKLFKEKTGVTPLTYRKETPVL